MKEQAMEHETFDTESRKFTKSEWIGLGILLLVSLFATFMVSANGPNAGGGTEFDNLYNYLSTWVAGTPGKLVAIGSFFAAVFNVMRQNWLMAFGTFVLCGIMAFAVPIINAIFLAGVPIA